MKLSDKWVEEAEEYANKHFPGGCKCTNRNNRNCDWCLAYCDYLANVSPYAVISTMKPPTGGRR